MKIGLVLIVVTGMLPGAASAAGGGGAVPRVVILWNGGAAGADSVDQRAVEEVFAVAGLPPRRVTGDALDEPRDDADVLVVPHAASVRMGGRVARAVVARLERGCTVVADGPGILARALGLRTAGPVRIDEVTAPGVRGPRALWSAMDIPATIRVARIKPRLCLEKNESMG